MKKLIILLIINTIFAYDADFEYYKEQFIQYHEKFLGKSINLKNIRIVLSDKNLPHLGFCYNNNIVLNRVWWEQTSEIHKEYIIFHELAHCALKRDHINLTHNGKPLSIMHFEVMNMDYYQNYKYELLKELFTHDKSDISDRIQ